MSNEQSRLSRRPDEQDVWAKLVVSLELADLNDAATRARLDTAAAAANNRALQATAAWQYAPALQMLTAAVEIWSRLDQATGEINARNDRGAVYRKLGDYAAAIEEHHAALALAQKMKHVTGEIAALAHLGIACAEQGDLARGKELLLEAAVISRKMDDMWGTGHAQGFLGRVYEAQKNWEAAWEAYGKALEHWHVLDAPVGQSEMTAGRVRVALAQGYGPDAYALAEQVLEHLAEYGPAHMDEPLRVYWTVYRVLHTMQYADEAREFLDGAHHLLQQQAKGLSAAQRKTFLNEVAVNRAIAEAWAGDAD